MAATYRPVVFAVVAPGAKLHQAIASFRDEGFAAPADTLLSVAVDKDAIDIAGHDSLANAGTVPAMLKKLAGEGKFAVVLWSSDLLETERDDITQLRDRPFGDTWPFALLPLSAVLSREAAALAKEAIPRRGPIAVGPIQNGREYLRQKLRGADGPILLEGETGTGKTETAHKLAELVRPGQPFKILNCGCLPEATRESTFRGVEKGRFTGVDLPLSSVFQQCHGGTLLLDDFQDLHFEHQPSLLDMLNPFSSRVEATPHGGGKGWTADVQTIVAINQPLQVLLQKGTLRLDLSYRVRRRLPLLRALREDLAHLENEAKREWFLRLLVLEMQERALRLNVEPWEQEDPDDLRAERLNRFHVALQLQRKGNTTLRWELPIAEAMPIPEAFLSARWDGNYRQLDSVAEELQRTTRKVGAWTRQEAEEALRAVPDLPQHEAPAAVGPPPGASATRLLGLAHLRALETSPTLTAVAEGLMISRNTLKRLLRGLVDGVTPKWFPALSADEQERLVELASQRVAKGAG